MNKQDRKVLACVDQSRFADTVADYAAWAARRMDAPLELLHVIDRHLERGSGEDHSGAIGFNAQEHLLHELSDKDAAIARAEREQGRLFLNRLRERALAAGAPAADMRQRHGALDDTLAEHEEGVRLFVFGRRGASAETMDNAVVSLIEQEMNGSPGMLYMESVTQANGTASVSITFDPKIDPDLAQIDVQNRLSRATPRLPQAVVQQGVQVDVVQGDALLGQQGALPLEQQQNGAQQRDGGQFLHGLVFL